MWLSSLHHSVKDWTKNCSDFLRYKLLNYSLRWWHLRYKLLNSSLCRWHPGACAARPLFSSPFRRKRESTLRFISTNSSLYKLSTLLYLCSLNPVSFLSPFILAFLLMTLTSDIDNCIFGIGGSPTRWSISTSRFTKQFLLRCFLHEPSGCGQPNTDPDIPSHPATAYINFSVEVHISSTFPTKIFQQ